MFRERKRWGRLKSSNKGKSKSVHRGSRRSPDPCWDHFLPLLILFNFVFMFHSCVLPFFHLIAASCHQKHRSWTVLISDSQIPATFTMLPLTILSLGANIYKLLKWPSMSHLLSLRQLLIIAEFEVEARPLTFHRCLFRLFDFDKRFMASCSSSSLTKAFVGGEGITW